MSKHCLARYGVVLACLLLILALAPAAQNATAQSKPSVNPSVVMLSDLHFDPFHDPAKVPLLVKAPIDQWPSILTAPDSPTQAASFDAIQKTCKAKESIDTPYALLASSLSAARSDAPSASFVTVAGDLLVHDLDCRYRATMSLPPASSDDQSPSAAFAEKTTVFVMKQVESTFAHIPVYLALGNNDSRCNHNRLDEHDPYLKASAQAVVDGLQGSSPAEKSAALASYQSAGYYTVLMPSPMIHTRLIVVDDIYMMPKYANCEADDNDTKAAQEQITWLQKQLDASRQNGERVWLLGHLPPAVNPDASLSDPGSFCTTGSVSRFQTTEDLTSAIISNPDVITLGIFGHTHMDELHLLTGDKGSVPVKVVGSVSPISGNRPSFTVGFIAPDSSRLSDYTVYEASNSTGIDVDWAKEYSFDQTYREPNFSRESLAELIARLHADPTASGIDSHAYQTHFLKGSSGKKLSSSWPGYICSLDQPTAKGFKACVCAAK
jgi:sphingomyelin phosphodiesterase acid-like 3